MEKNLIKQESKPIQKKKKTKWMKKRHKVVTEILRVALGPYCKWKYGIHIEKFKEQGNRPYLVIMNHQTGFDQFFVGLCFNRPVYYIATEDIFSMGWVSKLISWLVAPIPIKKQMTDLQAVMTCARVAKEGGTIALAPEGNRTYSGKTLSMNPAIAKLVRTIKLPLAIFRIEGGYGVQPRWSDVIRRGKMRAYVSKVIEVEDYKKLSDSELFELIQKELYVNEAVADASFHHPKRAEYLERAVYVCPHCGFSVFESHDDTITCQTCYQKIKYLPTKELKGVDSKFPFRFVSDWLDYQNDFINQTDTLQYTDTPIYQDRADLSEVILYKNKELIRENAKVSLYGDRIFVESDDGYQLNIPFEQASVVTVLGKNKLNVYFNNKVYQFKGNERFNALKYVNIFHRTKNIRGGNENEQFLGL